MLELGELRMDYKKSARERDEKDLYATETTGIEIEDAYPGYAKCSLKIEGRHLNMEGFVMGGAIFTLADFAFAVASNCGGELTVTLTSKIDYISASKGPVLFGEAKLIKSSKKICFYEIEVSDDGGNLVAKVSTTGYIKE